MRFAAIKQRAAYQATGDADEAAELEPYASQYVNEGYERFCLYYGIDSPAALSSDDDEPALPDWAHPALADWATFQLLRNGGPQRQQRGMQFRAAFEEAVARAFRDGCARGKRTDIVGVYP